MALLESDPVCLKLDDDGDVVVPLQWVRGLEAVAQGIRTRMSMFRGEWFLDLDVGVPYYQDLLGRKFDEVKARRAFRDAILDTPGVVDIISLEVTYDGLDRVLSVSWEARTEFGDTPADKLALTI